MFEEKKRLRKKDKNHWFHSKMENTSIPTFLFSIHLNKIDLCAWGYGNSVEVHVLRAFWKKEKRKKQNKMKIQMISNESIQIRSKKIYREVRSPLFSLTQRWQPMKRTVSHIKLVAFFRFQNELIWWFQEKFPFV